MNSWYITKYTEYKKDKKGTQNRHQSQSCCTHRHLHLLVRGGELVHDDDAHPAQRHLQALHTVAASVRGHVQERSV